VQHWDEDKASGGAMNFAASVLKQGTQLSSMSCFLHAGNPRAATFATAQQPGLLRSTAPDIAALQLHASVLSPVAVLHVAPVFVRAVPASTTSSSTCSVDNAQNCRNMLYSCRLPRHFGAAWGRLRQAQVHQLFGEAEHSR
jgi:hypothetical protein